MTAPQLTVYANGQGAVTGDGLNTFEQTCDDVGQLRAFIGAPGVQVFIRGYLSPGDGGQGAFWWDVGGTGPDNGSTIIVPPGGGGCWVRLSTSAVISTRIVHSGSTVFLTSDDYMVIIRKTTEGVTTVNLPTAPLDGQIFVVKDGRGDAASFAITINGGSILIDGAVTFVLSLNWESVNLTFDGERWNVW